MADLSETLIAAVRRALDEPDLDVRILDRGSRWISDVRSVAIRVVGIRRIGSDEPRLAHEEPTDDLRETIHGVRVLRLQITVDGVSHAIGDASEDLADRLIAGLAREDVREILAAENLSAPVCDAVSCAPVRGDSDDVRSVAVFEASISTSRTIRGALLPWIETAPVTSVLS